MKQRWSREEITKLQDYADGKHLGVSVMSLFPTRTIHSVYRKLSKEGMSHRSWEAIKDFSTLSQADSAYIAGIIDGEGCIHHVSGKEFSVSVSNTSYDLIQFLHNKIGGSVYHMKKRQEHHKEAWMWSLRRYLNVAGLLGQIFPYLIIKKSKAMLAIEAGRTKLSLVNFQEAING